MSAVSERRSRAIRKVNRLYYEIPEAHRPELDWSGLLDRRDFRSDSAELAHIEELEAGMQRWLTSPLIHSPLGISQ